MIDFGRNQAGGGSGRGMDVDFMGHTCHADAIKGDEWVAGGNCGSRKTKKGHVCFPSGSTARAGERLSAIIHKHIVPDGPGAH